MHHSDPSLTANVYTDPKLLGRDGGLGVATPSAARSQPQPSSDRDYVKNQVSRGVVLSVGLPPHPRAEVGRIGPRYSIAHDTIRYNNSTTA